MNLAPMDDKIQRSVIEIDEKKEVCFINLKLQEGKIVEFGAIQVSPEMLQVEDYKYFTTTEKADLAEMFSILHNRVWIFHNVDIEKLVDVFKRSEFPIPEDICRIDTHDWYSGILEDQDLSLDALIVHFGLNYEDKDIQGLKLQKIPKAVCQCYLQLEVFKLCAGVKTLKLLAEESSEEDGEDSSGLGPGGSSTGLRTSLRDQERVREPRRPGMRSSSKHQATHGP